MSATGSSDGIGWKGRATLVERVAPVTPACATDLGSAVILAGKLAKSTSRLEKALQIVQRRPKGPECGDRARAQRSGGRVRLTASASDR